MSFTYEQWTPPPVEKRTTGGATPKPSIHADVLLANYSQNAGGDGKVWTQFVVGPRGSNPDDPYDASIAEHTLDLIRAARRENVVISFKVFNAITDEHVLTKTTTPDGQTVTADQVLTDVGVPAVIRFTTRAKRVRA